MPRIRRIPIEKITFPKELLRKSVDEERLAELARSIEQIGLLQPVVVREVEQGFELIAGFRRTMAHRMLGLGTILAVVQPAGYTQHEIASIVENIQREDLPLIDECQGVRVLVEDHGLGIAEVSRRLGKGRAWVIDRLDVLRLPERLAEALQNQQLSMGAALELARIPNDHLRDMYTHYAVEGGLSIAQARKWRQQATEDLAAGHLPFLEEPPTADTTPPPPPQVICYFCEEKQELHDIRVVHICAACVQAVHQARKREHG